MKDPNKNHISIDPATVVLIGAALILLPLVFTGLWG
jgi:preprotein translocase subunit Sec61beta